MLGFKIILVWGFFCRRVEVDVVVDYVKIFEVLRNLVFLVFVFNLFENIFIVSKFFKGDGGWGIIYF